MTNNNVVIIVCLTVFVCIVQFVWILLDIFIVLQTNRCYFFAVLLNNKLPCIMSR